MTHGEAAGGVRVANIIWWFAGSTLMKAVFDHKGEQISHFQATECPIAEVLAACDESTQYFCKRESVSRADFEHLAGNRGAEYQPPPGTQPAVFTRSTP